MSLFKRSSAFTRHDLEKKVEQAQQTAEALKEQRTPRSATFQDEENQPFKHDSPAPTMEGPSAGELERWYYLLNSITTRGIMDPQDWEQLDELRDEVYRYLR